MVEGMDEVEFASYAAVYQAYAWHQGYEGKPVRFRIPDENFVVGDGQSHADGFDLKRFMRVVDELDSEGAVHYWRHEKGVASDGPWHDDFLTLVCTEDDSIKAVEVNGELPDDFHRPYWFFETDQPQIP